MKNCVSGVKRIAKYRGETIMPHMPWRFYRYMLVDVLRQFAITAVILVVVIAFGATIKPLSNG